MTVFVKDDGGRGLAGYKGEASDCACRAIAIATTIPYYFVYEIIHNESFSERRGKRKRGFSSPRTGVYAATMRRIMKGLGWHWTPTMGIGTGCKVHVRASELPSGRLILSLSRHYAAFIDGVLHDTHDSSRDGMRCVYGYWSYAEGKAK